MFNYIFLTKYFFFVDEHQGTSPFVEVFHKQLISGIHKDFFDVFTATNETLFSNGDEVGLFFSTLRKLVPLKY